MQSEIQYRVPFADTDKMGVVYYANYFVYFERVRNEVLRDINFAYPVMEASGLMLPVTEAHCDYMSPAYFDDVLTLKATCETVGQVRIKMVCSVERDATILAQGHTIHACLNIETRKPKKLPSEITSAISG